jgi:hypothetical protein
MKDFDTKDSSSTIVEKLLGDFLNVLVLFQLNIQIFWELWSFS